MSKSANTVNQKEKGTLSSFSYYGIVPIEISRNHNLSVGAKALYAYLASYVSAEHLKRGVYKAWPSRKRILKELNISVNTFGKYLKELKDNNFVQVKQGRDTKNGRQVYSNNVYILLPYEKAAEESGARGRVHDETSSESEGIKVRDTNQVNPSTTSLLSNTKDPTISFSTKALVKQEQMELVLTMIDVWNESGVNPHSKLGKNTKERIRRSLVEALEEYSLEELIDTISIYSRVYKSRRCKHKYRLVEFLERKGYEHFTNEENWRSRKGPTKMRREDFTYTILPQDRSRFAFLHDDEDNPVGIGDRLTNCDLESNDLITLD